MKLDPTNSTISMMSAIGNSTKDATYSDVVVCQAGKVQYLARGALVQVENDSTHSLPDFAMTTQNWSLFLSWIGESVPRDGLDITFTPTNLTLTRKLDTLTLPLIGRIPLQYANIDEVVLAPLLTSRYTVELPQVAWTKLAGFAVIHTPRSSYATPTVTLALANGQLKASSSTSGGVTSTITIPLPAGTNVPVWTGTFSLDALIWDFTSVVDVDAEQGPANIVKLSFTDNTKTSFSPLLVTYENGVTVVASPMYA